VDLVFFQDYFRLWDKLCIACGAQNTLYIVLNKEAFKECH